MDLQTAYVPSPLYSPREDSVSTASIVAMVAIFGYSLQRMTARRPLDVVPGRTAMLSVVAEKAKTAPKVPKVLLDPTTLLKAKLLAECDYGLPGEQPNSATVSELVLGLEAQNKTKSPALSSLLNGKWKFIYASGASPAFETLKFMVTGAKSIPKLPFGPAPVSVEETFLTIGALSRGGAPRYSTASTKVSAMSIETKLELRSKLEADTPVRLIETYESATSQTAGLFPMQVPALPFKRPVLVSYLDEAMLIVRDAAGRPDVLTRVDTGYIDTTDIDVGAEEVKEIADEVVGVAYKARDPILTAFDKVAAAQLEGAERIAFFEQQAALMTERAAFFMEHQDDLAVRVAQYEEHPAMPYAAWTPFGVAEVRAFCQEKAELFKKEADALTERLLRSLAALEERAADAAQELKADAMSERVTFLLNETEAMKARVNFCDEATTADAQAFLHERRVFLQREAEAMTKHAAFFQQEADALKEAALQDEMRAANERAAFFEATKKKGPFSFLRRKGKGAQAKAASVSAPIAELVETVERPPPYFAFAAPRKASPVELVEEVEGMIAKESEEMEEAAIEELTAIKKRGLFGFLRRKKGKAGKANARKPKKGRVQAKSPKRGWFGFRRGKKASRGDGNSTA
jgi:hypothetical protein